LGATKINEQRSTNDAYIFFGKKGRSDGQDFTAPLATGYDLNKTFYMDKSHLNVLQYAQS
jgi:hypothetical protein